MTLIIGLMSPKQAILVSDRRFATREGKPFDDEKNKATVLMCEDGRVAVAFTGLAAAGKLKTSNAVLRLLAQAAQRDHLLGPTIHRFTCTMGAEIKRVDIPARYKHLRFIFAGYRYDSAQSKAKAIMMQVTNVVDRSRMLQESASEEFLVWEARDAIATARFAFGTTAGISKFDGARLREMLVQAKPAGALVDKVVDTIQNAADSPLSKNMVGKQCTSIVIPMEPNAGIVAGYHSAKVKNKLYMPSFVVSTANCSLTDEGAHIEQLDASAPPLVVPKVGRNEPCPCGSGKKYKKCCALRPQVRC